MMSPNEVRARARRLKRQHGLGLMLGSTANAVLHGAECDVLAVRVNNGS